MRRVRSHRHVHRHRHVRLVRRRHDAMRRRTPASPASAAAVPAPRPCRCRRGSPSAMRQVHLAPGLLRRAESPVRQHRFHVLAGLSRDRDLEIVNRRRAVHHEPADPSAPHQIQQHIAQAALHHVAAHAPQDRSLLRLGPPQRFHHSAKRIRRQHLRQGFDQPGHAFALAVRPCEMLDAALCRRAPQSAPSSAPSNDSGFS